MNKSFAIIGLLLAMLSAYAQNVDVTPEIYMGEVIGTGAGMVQVGDKLYLADSANGLQVWDMTNMTLDIGPTDPSVQWTRYEEATSLLARNPLGTELYLISPNANDPFDTPGTQWPWRDLNIYNIAGDSWSFVSGDGLGGGVGDHSPAVAIVNGQTRVYFAWLGATQYTALNPDNTKGPNIGDVGNRWAGAVTEAYHDGALTDNNKLFALVQVDATGARISNHVQQYNAIAEMTFDGAGTPQLAFLGGQGVSMLPWETNCPDGGCVNRHTMDYEIERREIYVLRGGDTNQIGIYSVPGMTWRNLFLMRDGQPFNVRRADIHVSLDRVYIMAVGEDTVFSFPFTSSEVEGDTNGDGCVDDADLTAVILDFGAPPSGNNGDTDVDNSGEVDDADITVVILKFGNGC